MSPSRLTGSQGMGIVNVYRCLWADERAGMREGARRTRTKVRRAVRQVMEKSPRKLVHCKDYAWDVEDLN